MPAALNRDVRIHYQVRGDGPPLVMLYGLGGDSQDWWDEFPGHLAGSFRLYMVDNRGTGASDKPREAWSMADMADDVLAVVQHAGLDSFHLLGCSLGSMIARQFVSRHGGDRIRSLSLLCAPNGIQATEEDRAQAFFWDPARPLIESARKSWEIIHPGDWIAANERRLVREFKANMADPTPARTFRIQMEAAMQAGDLNAALNRHDWPVLIIQGDRDRLVPPANAATLQQAVPRARLEYLPGCSHNFWSHAPGEAAAIIQDFLLNAERAGRPQ